MDISAVKTAISALIYDQKEEIIRISDQLYRYPETGLQEHKSSMLLAEVLENAGFALERGIAGLDNCFSGHLWNHRVLLSPSWQKWMPFLKLVMPAATT